MRIFNSLEQIRGIVKNPAVTIGSYDGVHAAHRAILSQLNSIADEQNGESVVVTFEPHPRTIVNNCDSKVLLLNSLKEKIYLLNSVGIDNLFVVNFTPEFASLSSEEFARKYLFEGIGAKALIMGYNHHFGRDRSGDKNYLETLRSQYDFKLFQMEKLDVENSKVSSTVIRSFVSEGDFVSANKLLCAPYLIISKLDDKGNLELDEPNKLLPRIGDYPVIVTSKGTLHQTTLSILEDRTAKLKSNFEPGEEVLIQFMDFKL